MAPKRRSGGGGRGGGGDKKAAFWDAIANQALPTIRWSLLNAGVAPATRNEDGLTSMMIAVLNGRERSLKEIIQFYERRVSQLKEALELRDDDGKTPLIMAAELGKRECLRLLLEAGANAHAKDGAGRDARAAAVASGKPSIAEWIDDWLRPPSSDEEEESGAADDGLTSTQRSKLKKQQLLEKETLGVAPAAGADGAGAAAGNGGGTGAAAGGGGGAGAAAGEPKLERGELAADMPPPVWPEVGSFETMCRGRTGLEMTRGAEGPGLR